MSGGYFDYQQHNIGNIIDTLERVIKHSEDFNLSEETLERFNDALFVLEEAWIYTQRIDWLLEGDDSEESFHERLVEELGELYNKRDWS